ncbi:MAG: TraB/GumN family protein [Deltaproteobacteria bacterium]|nr:TraB/GumN family protein [Deltaproteobacteria bacterium]MBN2688077.1 TraB/GumN family protein [Deltaproteobacteria bacterium]
MDRKNVHRVSLGDRDIVIVGTAHVSRESADLVELIITQEQPDAVCVELCAARYDAITEKDSWEKTDIFKIIKEKRTSQLLAQLLMASFQKRLAEKFGINPGEEMKRAITAAEAVGAEVVLADRDIRTTMIRTWRTMTLASKFRIVGEILLSLVYSDDITEEDIEKLKEHDALELALQTFGRKVPEVKTTLIDERDAYLAHKIASSPGSKIVAVVGAGHVPGIIRQIGQSIDISSLLTVPPRGIWGRLFGWGLSLGVIAIIIAGFYSSGTETGIDMVTWWFAVNGILAGTGAIAALGHPITIAASVAAAPFTSLNPMVAAGWVAGLVEASLRKPQVKDFIDLRDDIATFRGFRHNKITRILLLVVFVNLGSAVGTFVAIPLMMRFLNF